MDFFQHQDRARKRTTLLLGYFFLAVLLTVLAVNVVFWLATRTWAQPGLGFGGWFSQAPALWATLATLAVILAGSLSKYFQLREGGEALATLVGARLVDTDTTDLKERQLLNIVEEMAIASGTPAPTTWVMDGEAGINAFVAGFTPTEAVLVVTKGSLDAFNRDEMQGVVGHEFSHLLNGDMRLNVNLYAILAGILAIGRVGEFLLRSSRGSSSSRGNNKGGSALVVIGAALMAIGYIGLFFGRLIKAAISRQREFLADASSVQFTRNPAGIGEALLKIRNAADGSLLHSMHAEDMSHMCFALPVSLHLESLLATHPPIDARISAIDAALLARDRARQRMAAATSTGGVAPLPTAAAGFAGGTAAGTPTATRPGNAVTPGEAVAAVGTTEPGYQATAARIHASIPEPVRDLLRTPAGARLACYGLLVAMMEPQHERAAIAIVETQDSASLATRLAQQMPVLRGLGTRLRLPCLDIALPALRTMSDDQKRNFLRVLESLVRVDGRYSVREFIVVSLMHKHLASDAGRLQPVRHRAFAPVAAHINTVLTLLCHASGNDDAARRGQHARLLHGFGIGTPELLPLDGIGVSRLREALAELSALSPLLKKPLLDACAEGVSEDGRIQVAELELLRAIADALDCPIPPLAGAGA